MQKWKLPIAFALALAIGAIVLTISFQSALKGKQANEKSSSKSQHNQKELPEIFPSGSGATHESENKPSTEGGNSPEEIKLYIQEVFLEEDKEKIALFLAWCESRYNPRAISSSGRYKGLFQFLPSTYYANGGTDIWDWREQVRVVKSMLDKGMEHHWPACINLYEEKN